MSNGRPRWLLLHGTPLDGAIWNEVVGELGAADEARAPNLVLPDDPLSLQAGAARHLLDTLGDEAQALDVVGHSFGGQIALEMAIAAPERIRSLVIVCSRDTPFSPFGSIAAGLRAGAPIDIEAALKRWFRPSELSEDAAAVRHARDCLSRADSAEYVRSLDAIACFDRSRHRSGIDLPVTLIAADSDAVSTPSVMAQWADALPRARYRLFPDAAHMSPFARPREFAQLLDEHARWR